MTPTEAAASVTFIDVVIALGIFIFMSALGIWLFLKSTRSFAIPKIDAIKERAITTLVMLVLCLGTFYGIRASVTRAVGKVSMAYFSDIQFANHAAVNPIFSFFTSLGSAKDYGKMYNFYSDEELAERIGRYRAESGNEITRSLLSTDRPDILIVVCEGYARWAMDGESEGRPMMPRLNELAAEGILFENMYANGARTDKGVAAVLSGYPTQPKISIMKIPAKTRNLNSIASSLKDSNYRSHFFYGGDLNFMDMSSYLYATGWERLVWDRDINDPERPRSWGYSDGVMGRLVAKEFVTLAEEGDDPILASFLTLSNHEPYDVPTDYGFANERINACYYSDASIGAMVDSIKESPIWDNTLIIIVADHTSVYQNEVTDGRTPMRHRIPMIWCGGAIREEARGYVEENFLSQVDIPATLLAQMGVDSSNYLFSRNIYSPTFDGGIGYYTFNEGFGVVTSDGATIYDIPANRYYTSTPKSREVEVVSSDMSSRDTERAELGKALLHMTHKRIGEM